MGISGWDYPGWRRAFYLPELPRRAWLAYASRTFERDQRHVRDAYGYFDSDAKVFAPRDAVRLAARRARAAAA